MGRRKNIISHNKPWPADKVERRDISSLVGYERNSRLHSPEQIAKIAKSITEFGFTNPVLIDESGGIIAGHARVAAAKSLGITDVPCIVATGWSPAQKKAYVIADNALALGSTWDEAMLKIELGDLQGMGFDLSLTGFSLDQINGFMVDRSAGLTDPDDAPEPPASPISKLGDVWVLGGHRLACGDCTSPAVVASALGGAKPHLMVTDPPYGVSYDPTWADGGAVMARAKRKSGAFGPVMNDDREDWTAAWTLFSGQVAYCWHAGLHANTQLAFESCGFELRSQVIWAKSHFAIGRGHYHVQHEPCFYLVRKGATARWEGDRKQTTVWAIDKPSKSETGHSTQKPIECMKRPIENNSKPGDFVYEPFSGSGTTIIAGEMTGRRVLAIELSPAYCDVGCCRWQSYVGGTAILEATGETFAEVKARRESSDGIATSGTPTLPATNQRDGDGLRI
jgi:DNA modification methylase